MQAVTIILIFAATGAAISGALAWRSIRRFKAGAHSDDFAERVATQIVSAAWESRNLYTMEIYFSVIFGGLAGALVGLLAAAMKGVK